MGYRTAALLVGLLAGSAQAAIPAAQQDADGFLATNIVTAADPAAVDRRCAAALALADKLRGGLEARTGAASVDADFRAYDALENLVDSSHNEMDIVAATNPAKPVRDAANVCLPKLEAASTTTSLSRPIYDRLAAIPTAGLDAPTAYVLHKVLLQYRLDGVDKDAATRAKVQALKTQISETGVAFDRNIAEDKSAITLKSADDLAGLPQDYIDAHKPAADGLIHITTEYPDVIPLLTFATREPVRRQMYFAFQNRAWPANEAVLKTLIAQRDALAHLLGFPDYAALITADKMIGTPQRVASFLDEVDAAATPAAKADQAVLVARQAQFDPAAKVLLPWNNAYVTNLVTKEKYEVDSAVTRQYFTFDKTKAGIFQLVHDLFGADIRPWDTPVWDKSVSAYELYDQGKLIGRFYLDMHPRDGKYNHAEQATLRNGLAGRQLPVGVLICNFPAQGPMEHDDVTTFLHEFGHLLHTIYSGHQQFSKQSMDQLQWDFIEAPSQLLEEWTWDYDTLKRFASDDKGQPIPQELVAKMNAARHFGEAGLWKKQLAYSAISLNYYDRAPGFDLTNLWRTEYDRYSLTPYQDGVHPYAAFNHLNGYSAIYYTYVWSKAIALDLFTRFKAAGIRDGATALGYRKAVLDPGGSTDANLLIQDFLGRPFNAAALKDYLQAH